jgi:chitosanase
MMTFWMTAMMAFAVTGCAAQAPPEGEPPVAPTWNEVSPAVKAVVLQLTTANENSVTTFQYTYAENLGDGRGITFGIVGFTTGTYDGNDLIKHYTALNPNNSLARYIPALDAVDSLPHTGNDGDSNDSTEGLGGFIEAVQSNTDPIFRQAQIDKMNTSYWNPSVRMFSEIGATYPLTQAFLYDMTVNHGQTGAKKLVDRASSELGGTPASGTDEGAFLLKLMDLRYSDLVSTRNPGADRVNAYRRLWEEGNVDLVTPFPYTVYGDEFLIDGNVY